MKWNVTIKKLLTTTSESLCQIDSKIKKTCLILQDLWMSNRLAFQEEMMIVIHSFVSPIPLPSLLPELPKKMRDTNKSEVQDMSIVNLVMFGNDMR